MIGWKSRWYASKKEYSSLLMEDHKIRKYVTEKYKFAGIPKIEKQNDSGIKDAITTWARACTIIPEFVGHTFMVHNGKTHLKVFITEDMVGHRLGEFAPTRSFRGHGGKAKATEKPGGPSAPPSKG